MSGSSACSDPQKTEEAVDHRQNNCVKAVGTSPVRSNLCAPLIAVLTAVRSRDTRTVSVAPAVWGTTDAKGRPTL